MTRLWETEAFAGQAARVAAKPAPTVRREDSGTQRFTVETEARAGTRHALEAARGRATASADLAEKRDAQRAATEKAGRAATAGSSSPSADLRTRPGSTQTPRAPDQASRPEATDKRRADVDDTKPDAAAKTGEGDDAVAPEGKEQASLAGSETAGERDEPAEIATPSPTLPGMAPSPAVAPPPAQPPQAGQAPQAGQSAEQPASSPAQAVAASAQAEAASQLDAVAAGGEAGTKPEAETAFAALLDPVATPNAAPAGLAPAASSGTVAAPAASPATPHQGAPVPLGAVPMTIGLRSLSGSSHFEIRLDPVDLGRIDVRLDIDKDQGTVTTRVVVDRPETLALLQRDAGNLQQALTQAGLDPGSGISLSLRGDGTPGGQGSGQQQDQGGGADGRGALPATDLSTSQPITDVAPHLLRGIAGIDIRI